MNHPSTAIGGAAPATPPPAETASIRLSETMGAMGECQKLVAAIYERIGIPQQPEKDMAGGPGIAGLTMAVRSEALCLRAHLEVIVNAL